MQTINPQALTHYDEWESPTVSEVNEVIIATGIDKSAFKTLLDWRRRTVTSWTNKATTEPGKASTIPYSRWCVLIKLAYGLDIYGDPININLVSCGVPKNTINPLSDWLSPKSEVLKKFISKETITGINRQQLANTFGYNSVSMCNRMNRGKIEYSDWVLILLLCGVDINIIFSRVTYKKLGEYLDNLKHLPHDVGVQYAKAYSGYIGAEVIKSNRVGCQVITIEHNDKVYEIRTNSKEAHFNYK